MKEQSAPSLTPGSAKELAEVLRSMLLPISPEAEAKCVTAVDESLSANGIAFEDRAVLLRQQIDGWRETGVLQNLLRRAIGAALLHAHPTFGQRLSRIYILAISDLRTQFFFSHDEAVLFLSHALLIAELAANRMTASQIARMLTARDSRMPFSWRPIQRLLSRLQIQPKVGEAEIIKVRDQDAIAEESEFADSDQPTSTVLVSARATRLGFSSDLHRLMDDLLLKDENSDIFWPYLQILHYQCVLAEYYDHAVTHLYEFAPRSRVPERTLFSLYEDFNSANNPFLNNAKSVDRVNLDWAASKQQAQAIALVEILSGLEDMSFAARKELAAWLRRWLLRVIRLHRPPTTLLPPDVTVVQTANLFGRIGSSETNTRGIIEQRVVDAACIMRYGTSNWRRRGIADSVNATNVSRRKLGDCDFQDATTYRVMAFEAHAGRLTRVYAQDHWASLAKSLRLRRDEEWVNIADPELWSVTVTFIAHGFEASAKQASAEIDGLEVNFRYVTFTEFLRDLPSDFPSEVINMAISSHVIRPLSERSTPDSVRRVFLQMIQ